MRTAIGIMLLSVVAAIAVLALEPGGPRYHRHDLIALHGAHVLLVDLEHVRRG